jgi:hypothetical protein
MASNIRRYNQGNAAKDPYDEQDFMKRDRTRVFQDEDETLGKGNRLTPGTPPIPMDELTGDALWDNYRIKPGTSLEDQIGILLVNYGKLPFEIEMILDIPYKEAEKHVQELEKRLRNIGKTLDGDDLELQRGIAIRQIQRYIQELTKERATNRDPKLLTAALAAQGKLTDLLDLTSDKKQKGSTSEVDLFGAALSKLEPDTVVKLHEFLKTR